LGNAPAERVILVTDNDSVRPNDFDEPAVDIMLEPEAGAIRRANLADSAVRSVGERALAILGGPAAGSQAALAAVGREHGVVGVVLIILHGPIVPGDFAKAIEPIVNQA